LFRSPGGKEATTRRPKKLILYLEMKVNEINQSLVWHAELTIQVNKSVFHFSYAISSILNRKLNNVIL
jgi:hypothetical protein